MALNHVILTERAGDALKAEMVERLWARYRDGEDVSNIAEEELADWAMDRFRPNIIHGLRRAGLDVPEDVEEFTPEMMKDYLSEQLDLKLAALTPEAVADALDERLSREVGRKLGISIPTLRDPEVLKQACIDAVVEAVRSGKANQLISQAMVRRFKSAKAWADAGMSKEERTRIHNVMSQRRWRKRFVWTWVR